jgi:hypothetical protein
LHSCTIIYLGKGSIFYRRTQGSENEANINASCSELKQMKLNLCMYEGPSENKKVERRNHEAVEPFSIYFSLQGHEKKSCWCLLYIEHVKMNIHWCIYFIGYISIRQIQCKIMHKAKSNLNCHLKYFVDRSCSIDNSFAYFMCFNPLP